MITSVQDIIAAIGELLTLLLPVTVGAAVIYFLWGLAEFIQKSGDEKAHAEGKNKMIWGIIALFFMVSIWGIISFLQGEFIGGSPTGNSFPIIHND